MKIWQAIVLGWAVLQSVPAEAGFWRDLPSLQGQGRPDRGDRGPQRQRDAGQPERFERQQQHQQHQRLSDDERRDLHRDLDKARREIYQPRRER